MTPSLICCSCRDYYRVSKVKKSNGISTFPKLTQSKRTFDYVLVTAVMEFDVCSPLCIKSD